MLQKTVRKRNGNVVSFDANKIITAISKANNTTHEIGHKEIETIANQVEELTNNTSCVDIEVIQDFVERKLQEFEFYETAKAYILYREKRHQQREAANNLMQSYNELLFTDSGDMDLKRDNANINGDAPMGIMLKLGAEGAKAWATNYALPEKFSKMDRENIVHIHKLHCGLVG